MWAPPTGRGENPNKRPGGSGNVTARARISKADEDEMMKRLMRGAWRPDRNKPGSGVEQLQRKLMDQEKRLLDKTRDEFVEASGKKVEKKSRQEIEDKCAEMFKRATERRKRLAEENIKKAEAQLPSHKKSSASLLERDMHFQRLSMPPSHRRMPRQQYHVRGSAAAEAAKQHDRPAWFGGATGREGLHKVLEKSGRHAGAVH